MSKKPLSLPRLIDLTLEEEEIEKAEDIIDLTKEVEAARPTPSRSLQRHARMSIMTRGEVTIEAADQDYAEARALKPPPTEADIALYQEYMSQPEMNEEKAACDEEEVHLIEPTDADRYLEHGEFPTTMTGNDFLWCYGDLVCPRKDYCPEATDSKGYTLYAFIIFCVQNKWIGKEYVPGVHVRYMLDHERYRTAWIEATNEPDEEEEEEDGRFVWEQDDWYEDPPRRNPESEDEDEGWSMYEHILHMVENNYCRTSEVPLRHVRYLSRSLKYKHEWKQAKEENDEYEGTGDEDSEEEVEAVEKRIRKKEKKNKTKKVLKPSPKIGKKK